jgi:hypothetical protein
MKAVRNASLAARLAIECAPGAWTPLLSDIFRQLTFNREKRRRLYIMLS